MQRRLAHACGVALVALLPACAQVLGVNDYSNSSEPVVHEAPPFDEKAPYLTPDRCERCIEATCRDERDACLADAECAKWVEEMRENNFGPIGDYLRKFLPDVDVARTWAEGTADPLATANAFTACISRPSGFRNPGCTDSCELGRDFACVKERFSWPATQQGTKGIAVRIVNDDGAGEPDWTLRYCGTQACDSAAATERTDASGFAKLSIEVPDEPLFRYLLADGPDSYPFMFPLLPGPIRSGLRLEQGVAAKDDIDAELQALGTAFDPSRALAWVFPRDCLGNPARHVTIDVWTAVLPDWQACSESDCPRIYPGPTGTAEVGQRDLMSGPRALITNLPARRIWLIVRDASTHAAVGMQKVDARAGTIHAVTIYPASAAEVDELAEQGLE